MRIDPSKLENPVRRVRDTVAACPACREDGLDKKGNHLIVYDNGAFGCCVDQSREHNRRILAIAGAPEDEIEVQHFHSKAVEKKETIYPDTVLERLVPNYSYWEGRGISVSTLKQFQGGLALSSSLCGYYVFPIRNEHGQIMGFTGRDTLNRQNRPKWMHHGRKTNFVFPRFNKEEIQKTGIVYLVESPACVLYAWEHGYKNVLCMFGVSLSTKLLNYLIVLNPQKIYVSTNNEPDNDNIGNVAAQKVKDKLIKFFNKDKVEIKLPPKKDVAECTADELWEFFNVS